ncbi:MAG: 16S rRNA processing protein RimM [Parvularculaceae bacterium]|jgi:16S rRNA processing protein RimM|nr:16S rRNA processing protein RimM [Parvularculaceae bacterium]
MSERKRVCLGVFAGAHGVRGDLKIRTFTEAPENIAAYGRLSSEEGRNFSIRIVRVLKEDLVLARADEIDSREAAAALSGKKLYVDRAALPPTGAGEFYIEDLVGLAAFDETGASLGRVLAMHNFGAGDIIEVGTAGGASAFVPFTDDAVPAVDAASGRMTVRRSYVEAAQGKEEP